MTVQWSLESHDILDSTQARAKNIAAQGGAEGLCVQALSQKSGHGRHGREWISPPGNLYLSFVLRPACDVQDIPQLSMVTALALANVINHDDLILKWPNDILIGGKKCAGILLEIEGDALVIGVGLNIASAPENAVCVDLDIDYARDKFLGEFSRLYTEWQGGGFENIRTQWLTKSFAPGTAMSVKHGANIIECKFTGLDSTGNLVIQNAKGETKTISAGEIHCC